MTPEQLQKANELQNEIEKLTDKMNKWEKAKNATEADIGTGKCRLSYVYDIQCADWLIFCERRIFHYQDKINQLKLAISRI